MIGYDLVKCQTTGTFVLERILYCYVKPEIWGETRDMRRQCASVNDVTLWRRYWRDPISFASLCIVTRSVLGDCTYSIRIFRL